MPDTEVTQSDGPGPSDFLSFEVLKNRSDFLRAARGRRVHSTSFVLQGWDRGDQGPVRVGFTCSKKVGNAVARNRAKRRLREIARLGLPLHGSTGWDYVLIGRKDVTAATLFASLQDELRKALDQLHP